MALANSVVYYTWGTLNLHITYNKFKMFAPTWNDEFDLSNGWYSISDIQDYFEYNIKNMKVYQTVLLCKFMWIESKIGLFLK